MVYRLRYTLIILLFLVNGYNLSGQINLDDFSIALIGNNTGVEQISESTMKAYFKGKYNKWPNNKTVIVVLSSSKHPKVELYSDLLYNKSFYAVKKYWYSLVFQGRNNPPYFFSSDQEIIEFVRLNPGAIAIVEKSSKIPENLKIQINE
jgi:hypothetical protein